VVKRAPTNLLLISFLLFVFCSTFSISFSQMALGIAAALFVVVLVTEKQQPPSRPLRWFFMAAALYVGWVVLRSLVCDAPWDCLKNARDEWLFVIVPITVYLARGRRQVDLVAACLSIGILVVTVASIAMLLAGGFWGLRHGFEPFAEEYPRLRGLFSHALTFGNFVATAAVFLLGYLLSDGRAGGRARWLLVLGGAAGIVSTLLSNSRGPIIALFVGLALLPVLLKGRWRLVGSGIVVGVLLLALASPGTRERFTQEVRRNFITAWPGSRFFIWEHSWQIARENLVLGVGPGNFAAAYKGTLAPEVPSERFYTHAHSDLLNTLAVFGIPGLVTFVLLWGTVLGVLWNGWRRAGPGSWEGAAAAGALLGSLAFLVAGLTEAAFVDEELRAIILLVWGLGLAGRYKEPKDATTESRDYPGQLGNGRAVKA